MISKNHFFQIKPKNLIDLIASSRLIIIVLFMLPSSKFCQGIVFSEIMFNPTQSNSEFIELFNNTNSKINLSGYKIKYHTSTADDILALDSNYYLDPYTYAVVFEADYNFQNGIYNDLLPTSASVFTLDDNAFGSSGMANTINRTLFLISDTEDSLDVYTYTANNKNGFSDERNNYDENIWSNSIFLNGTPGNINSTAPKRYDLGISSFYTEVPYIIIDKDLEFGILIKNFGQENYESFHVKIYYDDNENSIADQSEEIFSKKIDQLNSSDSLLLKYIYSDISEGENLFIALLVSEIDEYADNDSAEITIKGIKVNEVKGDIVINEFMYAPKSTEPEWIELYNVSNKHINLDNYQIADNSDTVSIFHDKYIIEPQKYFVVADDSSIFSKYPYIDNAAVIKIPTLNNSGDNIKILDSLNRTIDELDYNADWGGSDGNSLERISPTSSTMDKSNWKESIKSTPGYINSVTQKDLDLEIDTVHTTDLFPFADSTTCIKVKISNIGKMDSDFSVNLSEDINQDSIADKTIGESIIYSLKSNESVYHSFNNEIQIGSDPKYFVVKLICADEDTSNNIFYFKLIPSFPEGTIVINEIMYSPINYEPEWIELYNTSKYSINLENWNISDILTTPVSKTLSKKLIIPSKDYLVVSKSNSILDFHRTINCEIFELKFANLNNDADGIVIKDLHNHTIDSVKYNSEWSSIIGSSLERKKTEHQSINQNNWESSIDIEGSTPGRINSATPKDFDLSFKFFTSQPEFPVEEDKVKLKTQIINYGNFDAHEFDIEFAILLEKQYLTIEKIENLSLSSGDSLTITTSRDFRLTDTTIILSQLMFSKDQDLNNNYIEKLIVPGFNKNTVLINEIMFKPSTGDAEWVELLNNSDSTINLQNWLLGDLKGKSIISEKESIIESGELLLITEYGGIIKNDDSKIIEMNFPELGDKNDGIILYDYREAPIDSVFYNVSPDFKNSRSLERISTGVGSNLLSNWTFSLDEEGSTPGKNNSVALIPDYKFNDVIITEILYDPSEDHCEFIEIYNNSEIDVQIGGWQINDEDNDKLLMKDQSYFLRAKEYFILAADSSVYNNYNWLIDSENITILNQQSLNLTNTDKSVYLMDVRGNIIDSLHYYDSWQNSALLETKNISLELINTDLRRNYKRNWSSSVSSFGASPGRQNSINVSNIITESKLNITPNPFSPDYDGFEDFTFINYNLTESISQVRVRVFDSKGRKVRTIANNELVGSQGSILFDGLDERNKPLKIGIYIILFEAVNSNNSIIDVIKDVVVVARKF